MRKAVYAGSFDPITNGHLWMIEQASAIVDELIVAVGINPGKKTMFTVEDRVEMIREELEDYTNVSVVSFENKYLINFVIEQNAGFMIRGIRNVNDYSYESAMRNINSDINPDISSIFFMPPRKLTEVSSSLVKGLVGPEGWEELVSGYVPENVFNRLRNLHMKK